MIRPNTPWQVSALLIVPWLFLACAGTSPPHRVEQAETIPAIPREKTLSQVTAVEFKEIKDSGEDFVLLDVREKEEFNAAHLPGAVNISLLSLEQEIPDRITDTDTRIYVYCLIGVRSAAAAQILAELGYTDVINISDSFKGWAEAGYPVYNQLGEFIMTQGGYGKSDNQLKQ